MGSAFTYQGRLIDANNPADGIYDFQFKLYDANSDGHQIGGDVNNPDVDVIDGSFVVELDFRNVFDGNDRWLQIGVRAGELNDPNAYTVLSSRQEITPTPYALYAKTAGSASADSDWIISGNNMYSSVSGNVGIGTTSPVAMLDINESKLYSTPLRVYNNAQDPYSPPCNSTVEACRIHGSGGSGIWASIDDDRTGFISNYAEQFGGHFSAEAEFVYPGEGGYGNWAYGVYGEVRGNPNVGYAVYGSNYCNGTVGALGCSVPGLYAGVYGYGNYGVYGWSDNTWGFDGRGVMGESTGTAGTGVYGIASNTYASTNYGGSFTAAGSTGQGVYGYASNVGNSTNYGGYFQANGTTGQGVFGIAINAGNFTNYGGYFQANGNSGRGVRGYTIGYSGIGVFGDTIGANGTGVWGQATGTTGKGVVGYGGQYDFYAGGPGTNYGPFTGGHEVKLSDDFPANIRPGMIVSVTGETQVRRDDDGKISISSTLPTVKLCDVANDKAVFGVFVAEGPLPKDHWYRAKESERFATVNALGEGRAWVCNINGEIEVGDYITTSPVSGYGQKQYDNLLRSCTLGKATESVDWDSVTETIEFGGRTYKVYLIAVVYTSG
jgi:hypothetical protein